MDARGPAARLRALWEGQVGTDWKRPPPTARQRRADVVLAALLVAAALGTVVILHSMGAYDADPGPLDYLASAVLPACLAARRRFPLATLAVTSLAFILLSYVSPEASITPVYQGSYFVAIYTAAAWSRRRGALVVLSGLVVVGMFAWLFLTWIFTESLAELLGPAMEDNPGPLSAAGAYFAYSLALNAAYFGGALAFGMITWRSVQRQHRLREQKRTIEDQSRRLTRQAVVEERLRLARDLHDSIGHHFTGVGLLAGGVRRVVASAEASGSRLELDAASARRVRESLAAVEGSTREGIAALQSVLGVLRRAEEDAEAVPGSEAASGAEPVPGAAAGAQAVPGARAVPREPRLEDLRELIDGVGRLGLRVERVGSEGFGERWERTLAEMPPAEQAAFYRMTQEALTNVAKHSSATTCRLVLRHLDAPRVLEAEITDSGRPTRAHAADAVHSTGTGLAGLRERAAAFGGYAVAGPRVPGPGWTTRFGLPLRAPSKGTP
ncbi:histidine kinase [Rothia sp. AR01]|uniref:histidine kinase n=1 Tax=Rothia santali TaxID=2949643 RepID=A0A9X2KJM4_9MICC|nr:histidine kinase [Rothia santali]MCP3427029.1 histidine kinase [Rothia santali]